MSWKRLADVPPWEWPKDVAGELVGALRDRRSTEDDLLLATELSGELVAMKDELARELLAIATAGDRSERVRAHAALALGPGLEDFETTDEGAITEPVFEDVRRALEKLHMDANAPSLLRRRALEASVRAPMDWHARAIREAYASGDEAWKTTAVFCMGFVRGFDAQILEALRSPIDDLKHEAVIAAANAELESAWPEIEPRLRPDTKKPLLLAAIGAAATLRPDEAEVLLAPFVDSEDEEIAAEVEEALAMANAMIGEDGDDDDDDDDDE